ncbi:disease resistance protein RGA2-like [Panicum miliaceum]|uniref:Disease resistance protein RGA2-like n=1 Tax=Panicum miliaceum TaxID=4540 RepID=A0A3L6QBH2_PANMI|nr:disease resistance protein RGA2-like [Panicum miliaceum]
MAAAAAAFAGKGIATSVISYIINKAFDYLKDNKKDAELKSTKKRLEELVPQIQVVFDAVDEDQISYQSGALDAWRWQLRDAVEEAEDALDELEYYKLEEKVKMRDNKVSGSFHKFKGRVVQQFNHAFTTRSLKRLKSAVKTLDDAVSGVDRFLHVLNQIDNNKMKNHRQAVDFRNRRETSSLPPSMACFRYCSLFHKDYEFTKKELVYLWMGSGLIQYVADDMMPEGSSKKNMMPEDVGMEYLDTLTMKSFFDIKLRPRSRRAIKCNLFDEYYEEKYVMHDLLHELARSASVNECVRIDRKFSGMVPKTRHMYIELMSPTVVEQISQVKKLRTLIMQFQDQDQAGEELILRKVLSVAKSLRVLSLITNSTCKLPNTVNAMVHLRYLSVIWGRKNMKRFSWFPQSVYKLYHLEIMKFDNPQLPVPVKGEMEGACNLVNLRHLQLSYGIMAMIPDVGKLTSLCELYGFRIQQQRGYTIGELKNLKNICHLHISGLDKVNSTEEATEVMLDQKEKLSAVTFSWSPRPEDLLNLGSNSSDSCDPSKAEQILDKLQPHPNFCKLKIQGYPGSRSPCWLESLELINLTYLCLCDCKVLQHLPPIGQLPSLQYLYISNMESVNRVDSSFYGSEKPYGLQSLKVLEIEDMPSCTEWVGLDDVNLFPRLDTLIVRDCEKLRRVPSVPISIQHVEIHFTGLRDMPPLSVTSNTSSSSSPAMSLSKLVISRCPDLATLWQGYSLPALEELSIQQCASLSCLQEDFFCSLSTLKTFEIVKCPNLMTGEIRLPPTLQSFTLGWCSSAESPLFKSLLGLKSLKRLYLDGCAMLSLPSDSVESADLSGCTLELRELDIDHPSLLLKDPLQSITSVKRFRISGGPELTLLPEEWLLRNCQALEEIVVTNASGLQCLPQEMASLISLESLQIFNANLIQTLPDMPASLSNLRIHNCHSNLKERYKKNGGPDWGKVAYIHDVDIS